MTDPAQDQSGPVASPKPRRRWVIWVAGIVVTPILLFALYTATALTWSYSDGDRSGVLYKFSRKGWICKTWEGELNLTPGGASPSIWYFTVRDDDVAKLINGALGQKVALHYSEHPGVPTSCFGDTRYYVTAVRPIKE